MITVDRDTSLITATEVDGMLKIEKTLYLGSDGKQAIKQVFGFIPHVYLEDPTNPPGIVERRINLTRCNGAWREIFCLHDDEQEGPVYKRYTSSYNLIHRVISYQEWLDHMEEKCYVCEHYWNAETDVCILWELVNGKYEIMIAMGNNGKIVRKVLHKDIWVYSITNEFYL